MIVVFHNRFYKEAFSYPYIAPAFSSDEGDYFLDNQCASDGAFKVAIIATEDLNEAFRLTNRIDTPWDENPDVECLIEKPRPTSSGDIMVKYLGDGTKEVFVVAPSGFKTLGETLEWQKAKIHGLSGDIDICQRDTEFRAAARLRYQEFYAPKAATVIAKDNS